MHLPGTPHAVILRCVTELDTHRDAVDRALRAHGLDWDAWPEVAADPRLTPQERLSAVLVLLATHERDGSVPGAPIAMITSANWDEAVYDGLGRARQPWQQLSRSRLPWTPATATTAVRTVTTNSAHDERRIALALNGARQVCAAGEADAALLDAVRDCRVRLDREGDEQFDVKHLRALARRVIASATPPELLDLSLLVDGDAWAGPAREVARSLPNDGVAPLVRLLSDLGPRKPSRKWFDAVDEALHPQPARHLLRSWLELAANADIGPQPPGSCLDDVPGTLFVGTNAEVVRATVWATVVMPDEWPVPILGALARRGSAHNGLPGFPDALALKAAGASVDALIARGTDADRRELVDLREDLRRRDLLRKVESALA